MLKGPNHPSEGSVWGNIASTRSKSYIYVRYIKRNVIILIIIIQIYRDALHKCTGSWIHKGLMVKLLNSAR